MLSKKPLFKQSLNTLTHANNSRAGYIRMLPKAKTKRNNNRKKKVPLVLFRFHSDTHQQSQVMKMYVNNLEIVC